MDTIIIRTKDKGDLKLFRELAKRLGAKFDTLEDVQDEQLLNKMLGNLDSEEISKEKVIDRLNAILNEDQASYKNED